jgi:hypothetical protein
MSNASTEQPTAKRVRLSTDNPSILKTSSYSSYQSNAVSDPTLPPAITNLANYYSDKYMKIAKKIEAKQSVINKFSDDQYIPKSARLNFKLGISDAASTSNKYDALAATANKNIEKYESEQKSIIHAAAKLELDVFLDEKKTLFCEALYKLASIFYLAYNNNASEIDEVMVHNIVFFIITMNTNIISHSFSDENVASFRAYYYKQFPESHPKEKAKESTSEEFASSDGLLSQLATDSTISQYFQPTSTATTTATTEASDTNTVASTAESTTSTIATVTLATLNTDVIDVDDTMEDDDSTILSTMPINSHATQQMISLLTTTFVSNWHRYKQDIDAKMLNARLSKFATTTMKLQATNKAAELISTEPSATPQQISELIDKAVDKKTIILAKEIASLKQKMIRNNNNNNSDHGTKNNDVTNRISGNNKNNNNNKRNGSKVAKKRKGGEE